MNDTRTSSCVNEGTFESFLIQKLDSISKRELELNIHVGWDGGKGGGGGGRDKVNVRQGGWDERDKQAMLILVS